MTRSLRHSFGATALCVAALFVGSGVQAAPVSATWGLRQPAQQEPSLLDRAGGVPDPVLPVIESIGEPSEAPRLDPGGLRIAAASRLAGGDGANESLFAGGVASSGGNTRLIEGVSEARDPVQLLPPEPSVAIQISAPPANALLAALAVVIMLRNRARIGRLFGA